MFKVLALVHEDVGLGFSLAGVAVTEISDNESALESLRAAISSKEYGVIIVEQSFFDSIDERLQDELLHSTIPLIIPVPVEMVWRDTEKIPQDDVVARLIRQAVGYQLNIQV